MKHLVQYEIEMNSTHQFIKENKIKVICDDSFFYQSLEVLGIFNSDEIEQLYQGVDVTYHYNEGVSIVYSIIDDEMEEYVEQQEYLNYLYNGGMNYDNEAYDK